MTDKLKGAFDDHLFVALSLVIGVAVTSALESWTLIIRNLALTEISLLHVFWSVWAFFWAIQYWWGLWKYSGIEWGFRNFILFTSMAILIFLLNDLIYPEIVRGEVLSLEVYYFEIRPWFFGTLSLLMLLTTIRSLLVVQRSMTDRVNITYYISMGFAMLAAFSADKGLHQAGMLVAILLFVSIANRAPLEVFLADKG